ncbi:MAG: hypothetical protein JWM93_3244 [Frankiales bacterium]|nr:hypothetical protein [Frankiales bacterium]
MSTTNVATTTADRIERHLRSSEVGVLLNTRLLQAPGVPTPGQIRREARAVIMSTPVVSLDDAALAEIVTRAVAERVLPHTEPFRAAMALLASPAGRRYAARGLGSRGDVDDVLAEAATSVWVAMLRSVPRNGAAFATWVLRCAVANAWRRQERAPTLVPLLDDDAASGGVGGTPAPDPAVRLLEADAVDDLLASLRGRGASERELQRLVASALAGGEARDAVALLPEPCRPATLRQSLTSLRVRTAQAA